MTGERRQSETQAIVGVLLAGGLGRRIGGDKALRRLGGRPLIAHAAERLKPQVGRLIVNANGDARRLAFLGLTVVPDETDDSPGPLAGVLAALRWMAREAPQAELLASLPADVPFAPLDLVARLAAALAAQGDAGVAIAHSRGRRHPVVGLWRRTAADEIAAALAQGARKVEAMVAQLGAVAVPFEDVVIGGVPVDPLLNVNTPEDLERAEGILARASPPPLWGRDREGGTPQHPPSGFPPPLTPPHKGEGNLHRGEGNPVVVGIAGWKNSGKTTLVVKLVRALTARGYRVSTVKHSHHDLAREDAGTDSARHRAAGAQEVAVVSPRRWVLGGVAQDGPEPPLADVLARLAPADLVLVEGYKRAAIPKIEVRRSGQGDGAPLAAQDTRVFAIAADHAVEGAAVPVLDLDDAEGLADALLAAAGLPARKGG